MESNKNYNQWFEDDPGLHISQNSCKAALKASEMILEDSFDDALDWPDNTGAHYTLARRTSSTGEVVLMASKLYTKPSAMHMTLERYILRLDTSDFTRIPDHINPEDNFQTTSQADWAKFTDIMDSGMLHVEVLRDLETQLGRRFNSEDHEPIDWDKLLDE